MNLILLVFLNILIIFFYVSIYLMYLATGLGLDFLAPQGEVGLLILVTGFIFSLMMFYVGYISIREMYSETSTSSTEKKKKEQNERIAKLYPQS